MIRELLHRFAGTRPLRTIEAEVLDADGRRIGEGPLFERYFLCEIPRWVPLIGRRWGGGAVYLHHYLRSDPDRGVHDHPWDHAIALQLAGGYVEERLRGVSAQGLRKGYKVRRPGRGYFLKGSDFHRVLVEGCAPTSWSLFAHGPYRKGWGFLDDDVMVGTAAEGYTPTMIFRPMVEAASGRSKWWRSAKKGRDQKRADAFGRPQPEPVEGRGDMQAAARVAFAVAEDVQ